MSATAAREEVQTADHPSSGALRYRPAFDGLRGLGIALVLAEHIDISGNLGISLLRNSGSVALTMFFALSGYLITSLLLVELNRRGRIDLRGFYGRRAGRLFPALFVMLALFTGVFLAIGESRAVPSALAAALYVGNYVLIMNQALMFPYGQTWSLAVEEHFYALWPIALALLWRRWGLRSVLRAAVVIAAASMALRAGYVLADGSILHAGRGTAMRLDALLFGAAAALAVERRMRLPGRLLGRLATVGVFGWVLLPHEYGKVYMTVGLGTIALAAPLMITYVDHGSLLLRRVLASRPLVALGKISYSLYVWHWPLFALLILLLPDDWPSWLWPLAAVPAVLLAIVSYRYIEAPLRQRVRVALARTARTVHANA